MQDMKKIKKALSAAFPFTLPIFAGFIFLGLSYGIYMRSLGFPFYFPVLTSITVFAGSMEFVGATVLTAAFDPISAFVLTLMVNARHLFYGISLLDKYKNTGRKKLYMIFGLCDETFSINCAVNAPEGVDRGWFMFFVTLLDHLYWISGCIIGSVVGSFANFNTKGLDFVMTALFTVIFIEQWRNDKKHYSAILGLVISAICLVIFGAKNFIIPSMIAIIAVLTLLKSRLSTEEEPC